MIRLNQYFLGELLPNNECYLKLKSGQFNGESRDFRIEGMEPDIFFADGLHGGATSRYNRKEGFP
jgi:hypothetical protein